MNPQQTHRGAMALKRGDWFFAGLVLCAVCLSYINGLWGVFQFDDYNVIVNNPRIHSWPAWWLDVQHGIRPLLKLTYTADWTLGLGAPGFHLTNLCIHLCNVCLVWLLSRSMVAQHEALRAKAAVPLLAALLFGIHPAHTEAVTYICGRSSALMTLFYLAGLLAYAQGRGQDSKVLLHLIAPLCMLLALGVKETAVTFPLALLAWELYGGGTLKSAWRRQWSAWLLLAAGAAFFLLHAGYQAQMEISAGLNSLHGNVATQTLAVAYLLRQWVFPLRLNIDPDLPVLHDFAGLLPQAAMLAAVLALMPLIRRRRPWLSFALAWVAVQLLPLYWFLPRIDVANDRQLYLVGWPLALAVLAELSLWLKPRAFVSGTALLLVALGSLTVLRNQDYRSEVALWEATVQYSPKKARVLNNLGYAYQLDGRVDEARVAYGKALQADPHYERARYNMLGVDRDESAADAVK